MQGLGVWSASPLKRLSSVSPFAEIDIDAGFGKSVVARDRLAQLRGVDADLAGELVERPRPHEITALDELAGIAVPRINDTKTIFCDEKPRRKSARQESTARLWWLSNIASTKS